MPREDQLSDQIDLEEVADEIRAAAARAHSAPYAPYGPHAIVHRDALNRWADLISPAPDERQHDD